ncbi:hypothetical protein [Pseudomonas cichorii]|uniref:hypothetical protein n=1 Tax=Pseudomonas cichorii TaxID=36746 RepID=UPI0016053913|nr:hypothetical protein [Pseudomonas cichorii]
MNWLTPWQQVHMDGEQAGRVTQILLDVYQAPLQVRLQEDEEGGFIDSLQALRQQPWLASLERNEQLQSWVMILLHNTPGWSTALFEQVCALFGWDEKKGLHPQPAFIWLHLLERGERDDFVRHLHRLLGTKPFSVEGHAVHLLLAPYSLLERRRLARSVDDNVRIVCQQLVDQVTLRYPGVLEEFPHADLETWKRSHQPFSSGARRWLGLSALSIILLFGLSLYVQEEQDLILFLIQYSIQLSLALVVYFCVWRPACDVIRGQDEWLSVRLLPDTLSGPSVNARVLQHGMPLAVVGGGMWWQCGWFGLALHGAVTLTCLAFAPYRYPRPYAALRRMFEGRKALLGILIIAAFYGLMSIGFVVMSKPGGTRERSAASYNSYQTDCAVDNLRRTMPEACRTAVSSQECVQSEWAKRMHTCRSTADMVKKAMDSVPHK